MPGSLFFLGFAISSAIVPPLGDKYGRKWTFILSMLVQTICYFVVFFSKNIYLTIVFYFIVGLCSGGVVVVSTIYMNEFMPVKAQTFVTTALNCMDASIMITQSIYYSFNRDWYPLHVFGLIYQCIMLLAALVIPESPKFMYTNKRFENSKKILQQVARFNFVPNPAIIHTKKFDIEDVPADKDNLNDYDEKSERNYNKAKGLIYEMAEMNNEMNGNDDGQQQQQQQDGGQG